MLAGRPAARLPDRSGRQRAVGLHVKDLDSGKVIDGPIAGTWYSPVAWLPDASGFYYVRPVDHKSRPGGETIDRRVGLHRLGDDPGAEDQLVFGAGCDRTTRFDVSIDHGQWVIVSTMTGIAPRNDVYELEDARRIHVSDRIEPVAFGAAFDDLPDFLRSLADGTLGEISQDAGDYVAGAAVAFPSVGVLDHAGSAASSLASAVESTGRVKRLLGQLKNRTREPLGVVDWEEDDRIVLGGVGETRGEP